MRDISPQLNLQVVKVDTESWAGRIGVARHSMSFFRLNRIQLASVLTGALFTVVGVNSSAQDAKDIDVSVQKHEAALITGLRDFTVAAAGPDFVATERFRFNSVIQPLCVHSTTGRYSLSVHSVNGYTPFQLESTSGETLTYGMVVWTLNGDDGPSGARVREVFSDTFNLTDRLASPTLSCSGQGFQADTNLRVRIFVTNNNYNAASPGTYTDTVVLTVAPE